MDEPPPAMRDEDAPDEPEAEPEPWYSRLPGLQFLDGIDTLSRAEVKTAKEKVADALGHWCKLLDEFIPVLSRTHADVAIWSTITADERETMAEWLIGMGKRRAVAAQVVRGLVETYYLAQIGAITGPRLIATFSYYVRNGFVISFGIRPRQSLQQALAGVAA